MMNHDSIVIKFGVQLLWKPNLRVSELGKRLSELKTDEQTEAGFWIWDYKTDECYYSDKFKKFLGYGDDFSDTIEGVMNYMVEEDLQPGLIKTQMMIESKSNDVFVNVVRYKTPEGIKGVVCSGTIVYDKEDKPAYILGTHQILEHG